MENFKKVVRPGKTDEGLVFCKIEYKDGRLSISGVIGPKANGDCRGSCGQIQDYLSKIKEFADGWSFSHVRQFQQIWNDWHLNDLTAGSPAQEEAVKQYKAQHPEERYDYTIMSDYLAGIGLNPDAGYLKDGKPYKYGHAWLTREVPEDVLQVLKSYPETDMTPAWV